MASRRAWREDVRRFLAKDAMVAKMIRSKNGTSVPP